MTQLHTRRVSWVGVSILTAVLAIVGAVFLLLRVWDVPPDADRARLAGPVPIEAARLQPAPQPELAAYRAEKDRQLHGFGWVDAGRGIARIPIEAALDLLAAQGGRR